MRRGVAHSTAAARLDIIVGMEKIAFPQGFTWGAASAAYQVEGSPLADGAAPTNWHEFTHRRGTIQDGSNGDVACDHYHRHADDITLMRDLGLKAYRFSVGWARVFPEPGRVNQKGLDFYERLVDELLAAGIQPWLTIFHLEEPVWLSRMGGFSRRTSVDHLVRLGTTLFERLGDRVRNWITINEPTIYSFQGRAAGEFPREESSTCTGWRGPSIFCSLRTAGCARRGQPPVEAARSGLPTTRCGWPPRIPTS